MPQGDHAVQTNPGWYEQDGGLRYWDGSQWTSNRAPMPPPSSPALSRWHIASGVMIGILGAWFVILFLANASPDNFYLPVKFVVDELPEF